MKIKYQLDGFGSIDETYEDKLRIMGLNSKEKEYIGFIYILNIEGADVCKIGTTTRIFERMLSIRQIVKSVFPFIENSIIYNVFISKPVQNRFQLEKLLHEFFSDNNIDGEWYHCSFENAIKTLQQFSSTYICEKALLHIENMINPDGYKLFCINKEIFRLKYLKCIRSFDIESFFKNKTNQFNNGITLDSLSDVDSLCNNLEDFLIYIDSCTKDSINVGTNKLYAYKINARKQIRNFIQFCRKVDFNGNK